MRPWVAESEPFVKVSPSAVLLRRAAFGCVDVWCISSSFGGSTIETRLPVFAAFSSWDVDGGGATSTWSGWGVEAGWFDGPWSATAPLSGRLDSTSRATGPGPPERGDRALSPSSGDPRVSLPLRGTSSSNVTRGEVDGEDRLEFRSELGRGDPSPPYSIELENPRVAAGNGGRRQHCADPGNSLWLLSVATVTWATAAVDGWVYFTSVFRSRTLSTRINTRTTVDVRQTRANTCSSLSFK